MRRCQWRRPRDHHKLRGVRHLPVRTAVGRQAQKVAGLLLVVLQLDELHGNEWAMTTMAICRRLGHLGGECPGWSPGQGAPPHHGPHVRESARPHEHLPEANASHHCCALRAPCASVELCCGSGYFVGSCAAARTVTFLCAICMFLICAEPDLVEMSTGMERRGEYKGEDDWIGVVPWWCISDARAASETSLIFTKAFLLKDRQKKRWCFRMYNSL